MRVAIVGAGSIGVGWAVVFARAGFEVSLHDPDRARLEAAASDLRDRLERLAAAGLLAEPVSSVADRVVEFGALAEAVDGAGHVQECAPEDVVLKRELFETLEDVAPADAVLATSSSFLPMSRIGDRLATRGRCLVAHPGNPPYLLRIVEIVPAPFTDGATVERAQELFERCEVVPVLVEREVEGFVFNRLQGALLREAYCLVRDGVVSPQDVDRIVRIGLGRRWSVVGPFETVALNTRGCIERHAKVMGPAYARMGAERGQDDPWTPGLVARVAAALEQTVPLEHWDERVAWRDAALGELERARRASPLFED